MTAKELLNPRYEVIANYPGCPVVVGEIIDVSNIFVKELDKYPHLFRRLNWWEKRTVDQMPKRLICKAIQGDTEIMEIEELDMDILVGWLNKKERTCCSLRAFSPEYGYFPVD